jgi:manganese/zinc/iron transport system permease protein
LDCNAAAIKLNLMLDIVAQIDWWQPFTSRNGQSIMLVGAVTNVACALVGCYLVLRRMSLMGDAIAHAVLPGLVLALLFSGSMNILPLFLGAAAVGLLTTFLTQTLHQYGRVPADASMGVVYTSLFAIGVVLLKSCAGSALRAWSCRCSSAPWAPWR